MTPEEALDFLLAFVHGHWDEYGKVNEEPTLDEAETLLRRAITPNVLAEGYLIERDWEEYNLEHGERSPWFSLYRYEPFDPHRLVRIVEKP